MKVVIEIDLPESRYDALFEAISEFDPEPVVLNKPGQYLAGLMDLSTDLYIYAEVPE